MTVNDAYYEFSLLMNKNSERRDIQIDKINYLVLYNRESKRYLAEFIERNNSSDNSFTISSLLVDNFELTQIKKNSNSVEYKKPDNLFQVIAGNSYSNVTSTKCKEDGIVYNYFKKVGNFNIQIEDKFTKPSFSWERGLGQVFDNKLVVYTEDFTIKNTFITYYRTPTEINVVNPDYTVDLDVSDYIAGQINDRIVSEVYREFNSPGYNAAKTREAITI